MRPEFLSVVAPFNGSKNFKYFLQSLQQQTLDPTKFEVIIVEDGNHRADEITRLFNTRFSLRLVRFNRPEGFDGHSAGLCRNAGAQVALGEYLVFIDSDCVLHPNCLERHLEVLRGGETVAVCGYASELPASRWDMLQEGFYESYDELDTASKVDARVDWPVADSVSWDAWYSCNASVPRRIFFEAGGFDDSGFRCHDMDLAYRLFKAGCTFRYERDVRVIHVEHPRSIQSRDEQREGWRLLGEKHPELECYVFDRLLESHRYQLEVAGSCEEQFLQIVADRQGFRAGYVWVMPLGASVGAVVNGLRGTPHVEIHDKESVRIQLGLHRNCWDYEIFVPQIPAAWSPAVTVLIPFYNAGEMIVKAVSSVLLQSVQQFELILIDDASTDDSVGYVRPFINDARVRLYSCSENQGLSSALNLGLVHSTAQIIVHLDADDWLEPNALEEICAGFAERPDVGAVYGDTFFHSGEVVAAERGRQVESYAEYFSYEYCQAPRAYRKESLLAVGGWSVSDGHAGRYYEDRLTLAAVSERYEVRWLGKALYHCRYNPHSLSRLNPLVTASAKLAILYNEAVKRRYELSYRFDGGILKGELRPCGPPQGRLRWSVVIPFRRGSELLRLSVRSWLESEFAGHEGELIIVDDASGEDLRPVVALDPSKVRVVRQDAAQGPARARNLGAAAARYEMLFFSDADHIVPPDILTRHANRHAGTRGAAAVVGCVFGRRAFTLVAPTIPGRHKEKLLSILRFSDQFLPTAEALVGEKEFWAIDRDAASGVWAAAQRVAYTDYWLAKWGEIILEFGEELHGFKHRWTRLSTGSVSMPREVFERAGGFDERLKSMEDWELGIRLQEAGVNIVCAPEAEPLHQVHATDEGRGANNHAAAALLEAIHPMHVGQLLEDESYFCPPARYFFTPAAKEQYARARAKGAGGTAPARDYCLITFDDGPHPLGTRLILDALERHGARALFFLMGHQVRTYGDVVKEVSRRGHEIGVHSWTHTDSSYLTSYEVTRMLSNSLDAVRDVTGSTPKYARPPYGKLSPSYAQACESLGLTPVGWSASSEDWGANDERDVIIKLASEGARGKVLLFHDGTGNPEQTAAALEWLLGACRRWGIRPVTADEFARREGLPPLDVHNPFK
jgi:glycosyltransferase involved in cell wall biosynthesis/peptidoglycan/xylan/chitin deacetylase (PgdA/CDA1 family)